MSSGRPAWERTVQLPRMRQTMERKREAVAAVKLDTTTSIRLRVCCWDRREQAHMVSQYSRKSGYQVFSVVWAAADREPVKAASGVQESPVHTSSLFRPLEI